MGTEAPLLQEFNSSFPQQGGAGLDTVYGKMNPQMGRTPGVLLMTCILSVIGKTPKKGKKQLGVLSCVLDRLSTFIFIVIFILTVSLQGCSSDPFHR